MTDHPKNLVSGELPLDLLKSSWDSLMQVASQIADEIEIKSEGLSGNFYKEALAASNFFRGKPEYDRALNQPCVLAIANPLAKLASQKSSLSQADIGKAVSIGLCTMSRHGRTHRSLLRIFIYPIMLTYFVAIGSILVSHFLLPQFEQMYNEFGIALPVVTKAVLFLGYVFRLYTITILLVFLGVPPLLWLINWIGHEKRPPGMSRLDMLFSRRRPTVARWLLHFSLLLEAGLSKDEAIDTAASMSGKRWLKTRAAVRKRKISNESEDARIRFFDRKKMRMADTAMSVPRSRGQVVLLQQVASWYRDSSSNLIEWLVQLLVPLYVFAIVLAFFIMIISLFMPIIAIVSGLTGGGGGPGGFM